MTTLHHRGSTSQSVYFVTANCWEKKNALQTDKMAALFIDVLYHHRAGSKYLLHEFVVMPNHFHLLITPAETVTLEKALQLIKGGYSFRAKKELDYRSEIWQTSFHDRRIRDAEEYSRYREYIHMNPVKRGLISLATAHAWGSACGQFELDDVPHGLKP